MKNNLHVVIPILVAFLGILACRTDNQVISGRSDAGPNGNPAGDSPSNRITIRVGARAFTTTLLNNATVTAFKAQLPMTISMSELNGNEKFYRFTNDLPASALSPGTIQSGDLMLYDSNTLVLFYETFRTSYSYTRLGRADNPSGLAAALGAGSVTVTFALE